MTLALLAYVVLAQPAADAPVALPPPAVVAPASAVGIDSGSLSARGQLRAQRRTLMQDRPSFVAPGLLAFLGAGVTVIGAGIGVYGLVANLESGNGSSFGDKQNVEAVGGGIAVLGLAAIVVGIVWLAKVLSTRTSIDAQVEEIDGRLMDLGASLPALP